MLVKSLPELEKALAEAPAEVVVDVETYGKDPEEQGSQLLGVSLCWSGRTEGLYVPLTHFNRETGQFETRLAAGWALREFLLQRRLVGWNIEFDRRWVNNRFNITSVWARDVRVSWYLLDRVQTERGYSLKSAQKTLLSWDESNEGPLKVSVEAAGGKLSDGDHYLASLEVLAKYASLDTYSTMLCDEKLEPELLGFDGMADYRKWIEDYGTFLTNATRRGVSVDKLKLARAVKHYEAELKETSNQLRIVCAKEIEEIENGWFEEKLRSMSQGFAIERYRAQAPGAARRRRFNLRSGSDRALLFHDKLGLPIEERTETGRPKADRATYEKLSGKHPAAKLLVRSSEVEKLRSFATGYLEGVKDNRIHFEHNWCATVTGRLGGFAPYDLNMPFEEQRIMEAFSVDPGMIGIHMDLKAVEPCVIAAFSEDPTLMRLYRDGVGDVYLELALELFPNRLDLKEAYDPTIVTPDNVKKRFKDLRSIAKIVHLAVGYTGTRFTVAENLTKAGFPTTIEEAAVFVNRYWSKYVEVKRFAERLEGFWEQSGGYCRSVAGAYVFVPKAFKKDLMSRVVQRSGHEILIGFVKELYRLAVERQLKIVPVLPDIHDSHSAACPVEQKELVKQCFKDALIELNRQLNLPVTFGMEIKEYRTFFGLKGDEIV